MGQGKQQTTADGEDERASSRSSSVSMLQPEERLVLRRLLEARLEVPQDGLAGGVEARSFASRGGSRLA